MPKKYKEFLTAKEIAYITGHQYRDILSVFKIGELVTIEAGDRYLVETEYFIKYAKKAKNLGIDFDKLKEISKKT